MIIILKKGVDKKNRAVYHIHYMRLIIIINFQVVSCRFTEETGGAD